MGTVCELILEKGMDVGAVSDDGITALIAAAGEGHANIVQLLLEKAGADPNTRDKASDRCRFTRRLAGLGMLCF